MSGATDAEEVIKELGQLQEPRIGSCIDTAPVCHTPNVKGHGWWTAESITGSVLQDRDLVKPCSCNRYYKRLLRYSEM